MKYSHWGDYCCRKIIISTVFCLFVILYLVFGSCLAQSAEHSAGNSESIGDLLVPLQSLHNDLSRIEATLDGFANAKWEYKVLVPNILGNSGHDQLQAKLGPLGEQGWELVTYSPDVGYILKRRVPVNP